jgi:formylglycine-generating enzyme required for sulfatase activity
MYTWAGTNDYFAIHDYAWIKTNCTVPQWVGLKLPNRLGLYDMTGNVMEACWDWLGDLFFTFDSNQPTEASLPFEGVSITSITDSYSNSHAARGGSAFHDAYANRGSTSTVVMRFGGSSFQPHVSNLKYGFRIVSKY